MYQTARRGRENIIAMTKNTFKVATDPDDGRRFLYQAVDESDKNHGVKDTSIANEGRIYEHKEGLLCPVVAYNMLQRYRNPNNNALWQRPKKTVSINPPPLRAQKSK